MKIEIKTRLDAGIYKSSGGGKVITHYTWKCGPRNLLKAISVLRDHRVSMRSSYGDIGCGTSWLEIGGVTIPTHDLWDVECDDKEIFRGSTVPARLCKTPTQKARDIIAKAKG